MDNSDFQSFVHDELKKLKKKFDLKHSEYSTNTDALSNFRKAALLKYGGGIVQPNPGLMYQTMYEIAKDFTRKHIVFIDSHGLSEEMKIADSLEDIAIYSIIMLYMWNKYHDERTRE